MVLCSTGSSTVALLLLSRQWRTFQAYKLLALFMHLLDTLESLERLLLMFLSRRRSTRRAHPRELLLELNAASSLGVGGAASTGRGGCRLASQAELVVVGAALSDCLAARRILLL